MDRLDEKQFGELMQAIECDHYCTAASHAARELLEREAGRATEPVKKALMHYAKVVSEIVAIKMSDKIEAFRKQLT